MLFKQLIQFGRGNGQIGHRMIMMEENSKY